MIDFVFINLSQLHDQNPSVFKFRNLVQSQLPVISGRHHVFSTKFKFKYSNDIQMYNWKIKQILSIILLCLRFKMHFVIVCCTYFYLLAFNFILMVCKGSKRFLVTNRVDIDKLRKILICYLQFTYGRISRWTIVPIILKFYESAIRQLYGLNNFIMQMSGLHFTKTLDELVFHSKKTLINWKHWSIKVF